MGKQSPAEYFCDSFYLPGPPISSAGEHLFQSPLVSGFEIAIWFSFIIKCHSFCNIQRMFVKCMERRPCASCRLLLQPLLNRIIVHVLLKSIGRIWEDCLQTSFKIDLYQVIVYTAARCYNSLYSSEKKPCCTSSSGLPQFCILTSLCFLLHFLYCLKYVGGLPLQVHCHKFLVV